MARGSIADLSSRQLCEQVADPDQFSGGGSIAAVTAAASAATALLVSRLIDRRRARSTQTAPVSSNSPSYQDLIERFLAAADADLQVLDDLLQAQRAMKSSEDRQPYRSALRAAAELPIGLASEVLLLLELVRGDVGRASRFTVSDLGAAATLARGAAQAALLTAQVNAALLRDEPGWESSADDLDARIAALRNLIGGLADEVVEATQARIAPGTIVKRASA